MKQTRRRQAVYWCLLLLWIGMAVFLSRQSLEETARMSGGLTAWVQKLLALLGISAKPDALHDGLRKAAHVVIYLGMGFLTCLAFRGSFRGRWVMPAAAAVCLAVAVLDEVQKLAVPGRHCHWDEAALNALCALAGLLLGWLLRRRPGKTE